MADYTRTRAVKRAAEARLFLFPGNARSLDAQAKRSRMAHYERVSSVKQAVQGGLMQLPGVHAVGIGLKRVNDQPTDELSIVVFCVKKRSMAELAADEVVPPDINGVKTDVVEMDVPHLLAAPADSTVLPGPTDTDRPRPLLGGVALQAKGVNEWGTLGCFATTNEAQPKVVALTCQHVIAPPVGDKTTDVERATPAGSPNPYKISFGITGPNSAGSLIVVKMGTPPPPVAMPKFTAYWTVTADDTPQSIATNVMQAINATTGSGASAAIGQHLEDVIVTLPANSDIVVLSCSVYDPLVPDKQVELRASISGNAISFTGTVAGEYCVHVSWNINGADPTRGSFTALPKGTPVTSVPDLVAASITALGVPGITATPGASNVTINGAAQVSCVITRDVRVGQPTDSFSSNCSMCCSDEMGRVYNAHTSLDIALIQLRQDIQYLNEIKGDSSQTPPIANTVVRGIRPIDVSDVASHLTVHMRGAKSLYTTGTIQAIDVHGYTTNSGNNWEVFFRYYTNGIRIQGVGGAFSDLGDSGAAVFDDSGNIVGIVFATGSIVTPINQITSELNITIATSTGPNQVQSVTKAQGAPAIVRAADDEMIKQVLTTQAEIAATPSGQRYTQLIGRHAEEVQNLVNHNLRVAVVWHRNAGPEIVRAALRYIEQREERLPQQIDGLPLTERLTRIRDALMRYGSAELSDDLARYGSELLALTSLSFSEAVEQMRAGVR